MKKILLVEDNVDYRMGIEFAIKKHLKGYKLIMFDSEREAIDAISAVDKDFDVLLLDGDLGFCGHGSNILHTLTPDQLKKTIICSANNKFIEEAAEREGCRSSWSLEGYWLQNWTFIFLKL